MFELSAAKKRVVDTAGHLLITGGPGSGKTTIALIKANAWIGSSTIKEFQRVLFLSFARATVARVRDTALQQVDTIRLKSLEMSTYHGFSWRLLRSHGYLINGKKCTRLISPPDASARLAGIENESLRNEEIRRWFADEGILHFDLFADLAGTLLHQSPALCKIISNAYPVVILDEFQDTNAAEWQMIRALGQSSCLIALADADQRIYEFRGADPKRLDDFRGAFNPTTFDFGTENNRSNGTDINSFGNDLLTGANVGRTYENVKVVEYRVLKAPGVHMDLKFHTLRTLKQLHKSSSSNFSLVVLVPTNQLMMDVSDYFGSVQTFKNGQLPALGHSVAFDSDGPCLGAIVIAYALEGGSDISEVTLKIIRGLRDHIRGRRGKKSTGKQNMELAEFLKKYEKTGELRGSARKALIDDCIRIATSVVEYRFTGDPQQDWLSTRQLFEASTCDSISCIAADAKYLRLLHKGSMFRMRLSALWRQNGNYTGAAVALRDALLQEQLYSSVKQLKGLHVMTIHKAKGKEFDEVIAYEGVYQHRISSDNASPEQVLQARRNLRVAVTRGKRHTTLLTPKGNRCPLL